MGFHFIAFDGNTGQVWFSESVPWLRDEMPPELFHGNLTTMKDVLSPNDICEYWKDITAYLDKLDYCPAQSGETETYNEWYDKWVSKDKSYSLDDCFYKKLQGFSELLRKCIDMRLSARWSR